MKHFQLLSVRTVCVSTRQRRAMRWPRVIEGWRPNVARRSMATICRHHALIQKGKRPCQRPLPCRQSSTRAWPPSEFVKQLVPLRPVRGRSVGPEQECTVYIKGFLGRDEAPHSFETWLDAHNHTHWRGDIAGWRWESGSVTGLSNLFPAPILALPAATAMLARRLPFSPTGIATTTAAEAALLVARYYTQYQNALKNAARDAELLAKFLRSARGSHGLVRVVAHSLGCKLYLRAASLLSDTEMPDHVHLCAPAVSEGEAREILARGCAARAARLYWTDRDMVLQTVFRLVESGNSALGTCGVDGQYPRLFVKDVGKHFGVVVHTDYVNQFPKFFEEHE